MSLSCLIFDDEAAAIAEVSFLIGKYVPDWKVLGIASTIDKCKELLSTQKADIIFSDIHFAEEIVFDVLPELNDFKGDIIFIKNIDNVQPDHDIFISGDNGFATQAFQLSAISYILKPVNETHFKQIISKYLSREVEKLPSVSNDVLFHNLKAGIPAAHKKIAFNTTNGYVIKEVDDIVMLNHLIIIQRSILKEKKKFL